MNKPNVKSACWIALLLPSTLLMGCATPSPSATPRAVIDVPKARAPLPSARLMTRPRPEDYSARAQADTQSWQQRLGGSPTR